MQIEKFVYKRMERIPYREGKRGRSRKNWITEVNTALENRELQYGRAASVGSNDVRLTCILTEVGLFVVRCMDEDISISSSNFFYGYRVRIQI